MGAGKQYWIDVGGAEGGGARRIAVEIKNAARSRSFKIRLLDADRALLTKPKYSSIKEALEFLESSRDWLAGHAASARPAIPLAQYLRENPEIYGESEKLEISFIASRTSPFYVEDAASGKLVFAARADFFDADCASLFMKYAARKIPLLVRVEAERTGLGYAKVSVRDQSGRWGSRSSGGTLSFNWRIMLLPPPLRKYIICHELAHSRFMDHSVSFWIFLNRICPDAQKLDAQVGELSKKIFNIILTKG